MTRRICSGCGHTLVQPTSDVDGVMGAHMDEHTAQHVLRGEASWWVIDATPEPRPFLRAIVALLARAGAALARRTGGKVEDGPVPQDEINHPDMRINHPGIRRIHPDIRTIHPDIR